MKSSVVFLTGFLMTANVFSQTMSEKIQRHQAGEGTVIMYQEPYIRILLDGRDVSAPVKSSSVQTTRKNDRKNEELKSSKAEGKSASAQQPSSRTSDSNISIVSEKGEETGADTQFRKKVYKNSITVNGFRIRIYVGGSSRDARQKAYSKGYLFKSVFMDVPVYTHFYSPHWMCSVGNFKTYGEASKFLKELGAYQQFSDAVIIKSKIQVEQ